VNEGLEQSKLNEVVEQSELTEGLGLNEVLQLTEGLELMGVTCDELAIESFHKEKMTKKQHKLKTWSNTGAYQKAHTVTFTETEEENIIEIRRPSGSKSLITRTQARTLWKEYIEIGWKVAK